MSKKMKLLSITIVVAIAVLCTAGITIAVSLFDNSSTGSVTTADLNLSAKAHNLKVFSAVETDQTGAGVFADEKGKYYKYEQSVTQGDEGQIVFAHGGSVSLKDKSVVINGISPGDKVEFDIEVSSASSVSFNYRAELYVKASSDAELLNQLDFSAGDLGLLRKDVSDFEPVSEDDVAVAVITDYTEWASIGANQESVAQVHVTIALPMHVVDCDGKRVEFSYIARGVQNTAEQPDVAKIGEQGFKTLADAVRYAEQNDVDEISVVGSTVLEEGTVTINKAISFVGVANGGVTPVLKGVRISVINGAAVSFNNIDFAGESYIAAENCMGLSLTNCKAADVSPVKYFDKGSRSYLNDSAFVVSGSSLTPTILTLKNNELTYKNGAAVCMNSNLGSGSVLSGNTFGNSDNPYGGKAVVAFSGAVNDAVVTLSENTFYGNLPVSLGNARVDGAKGFVVVSRNNAAIGAQNGIFVGGKASAVFFDNGSTVDGSKITCSNIAYQEIYIGAVNVTLDNLNKLTAGTVVLSENITEADVELYVASNSNIAYYKENN